MKAKRKDEVEVVQALPDNVFEVKKFAEKFNAELRCQSNGYSLVFPSGNSIFCQYGSYIVSEIINVVYVLSPDEFKKFYEPIKD